MKICIFVSVFALLSTNAVGAPRVVASFVNTNVESCTATSNLADACKIAMSNTEKLKSKISALDPSSSDYKKWSALLPQMQANEDFICETVRNEQKLEMAVATLNIDTSVSIATSKLDKGVLGRVEFAPMQIVGDSIQIAAPAVRITVYGDFFCQAVVKAGGDATKALESIAAEIIGQ